MSQVFYFKYLCSSPLVTAQVSQALTYVNIVHITSAILALPQVTLNSLELRFLSDITVVHSFFNKNFFLAQAKYSFFLPILG